MRLSILSMLATLVACSTTPQQQEQAAAARADQQEELAAELAGLTPGEPSACLPVPTRTQVSSRAYGSTIIYEASRDLKYRNDTSGGCERLGRGNILVTRTPIGRSCRGDIVQTVDPVSGFQTGACTLGDFVPYRRQ